MDWIPIGEYDIQAYTPEEKIALAVLQDGKNFFQVASRLHVSFERARDIVFSIRKKESIIMGKLSNTERAAIYQAWKDGQSQTDLAKHYNVSIPAISKLLKKLNAADQSIRSAELPKPSCEAARIAAYNEQRVKEELEDCENGIPNTPLVPQKQERKAAQINPEFDAAVTEMIENTNKNSAIAEKNSTNAEPDTLPVYITDALAERISSLSLEIEEREQRIAELQAEIEDYQFEREKIAAWLEEHT